MVRPSSTGIRWVAANMGDTMFDATPFGGTPGVTPGRHRLVISVLGSYDEPSYNANGERAFDDVARCSQDVEARADAGAIDVLVTFTPDPTGMTYNATCSMTVGRPEPS